MCAIASRSVGLSVCLQQTIRNITIGILSRFITEQAPGAKGHEVLLFPKVMGIRGAKSIFWSGLVLG